MNGKVTSIAMYRVVVFGLKSYVTSTIHLRRGMGVQVRGDMFLACECTLLLSQPRVSIVYTEPITWFSLRAGGIMRNPITRDKAYKDRDILIDSLVRGT